jgi:hypothetical protein
LDSLKHQICIHSRKKEMNQIIQAGHSSHTFVYYFGHYYYEY